MNIVGISAHFHNSAACLLVDGKIVAAAEEERFTRIKHDADIPRNAFRFCLERSGLHPDELDCIAYYEKPLDKLSRQIWMGVPQILNEAADLMRLDPSRAERDIREALGFDGHIEFVTHHEAHAASAFFFSGFEEAAILTVDGVGEWTTTSYRHGRGAEIELLEKVEFPDSIGLLYSTITGYLGFRVNSGEYKVMGLAPYGEPKYLDQIRSLIVSGSKGQHSLNCDYFDFLRTDRMYTDALPGLFGIDPRVPESDILQCHKDIARSLQVALEEILVEKAEYLHEIAPVKRLCMAGGVALNCVANGKILSEGPFDEIFVQPASHDAGGALGAAALAHARRTGVAPECGPMESVYLGPASDLRAERSLVGFKEPWSLARALWARVPFWPIRVVPTCVTASTPW